MPMRLNRPTNGRFFLEARIFLSPRRESPPSNSQARSIQLEYTLSMESVTSANPEEGLDLALGVRTDIVLLELMMPTRRGLEVLDKIVRVNPTINVILLTGEYSTESAVEAIQKGAADYLNKPISVEVLRRRVGKFVDIARERHEATQISRDLVEAFQFEGIVGWSPLMLEVFDRIRRVAPHFRNILISGDTGTGKELVARSLHRLGPVPSGPF